VSKLPRHQRVVIALSVHILRTGVTRCSETRVDVPEIRLALRCLLPHCPEKWPLALYWDYGSQNNEIGRAQDHPSATARRLLRGGHTAMNNHAGMG
jgi:hypothetical protein